MIAASGKPEQIELIAQMLAPGAESRWAADAVQEATIAVLALPLHRFIALDPALPDRRLVIGAMNYWPPVDGVLDSLIWETGHKPRFKIVFNPPEIVSLHRST